MRRRALAARTTACGRVGARSAASRAITRMRWPANTHPCHVTCAPNRLRDDVVDGGEGECASLRTEGSGETAMCERASRRSCDRSLSAGSASPANDAAVPPEPPVPQPQPALPPEQPWESLPAQVQVHRPPRRQPQQPGASQ